MTICSTQASKSKNCTSRMVGKELDEKPTTSFEKGGRITFLRKFITVKSLVQRFNSTESDSWSERTIPNQDLDEKRTAS